MLKFNNNNIFTGYLKQLLTSFNLPMYKIYSDQVDETQILPGVVYLKNNLLQMYTKSEGSKDMSWQVVDPKSYLFENQKSLNNTRQLQLKNNIYDTYTHEYLGNFLRFIRDYYKINLMPLYNCFSDTLCNNLKINLDSHNINFNSIDLDYKIYMLPVNFGQEYTIALDCQAPIELCCGFFSTYQINSSNSEQLVKDTYEKRSGLSFSSPIIYSKLTGIPQDQLEIYAKQENNLKLFLKIPTSIESTITILEGNYTGYNNFGIISDTVSENGKLVNKLFKFNNHSVTNFDKTKPATIPSIDEQELNPITNLQLLLFNTGVSYPFADRLIEYLSGNVITSQDPLTDNIKRVQTALNQETRYVPRIYGAWQNGIQHIMYDYMTNPKTKSLHAKNNHDILGYIDKDVEKSYRTQDSSLSNIDIYPDLFKASKNVQK